MLFIGIIGLLCGKKKEESVLKKTVIGVVPLYDEKRESIWMLPGYMDGLIQAGAIPVILPLDISEEAVEQLDAMVDGYLFTGGHDIEPELYGEKRADVCGISCTQRDRLEQLLYQKALEADKPILGICRGVQMINVLQGGTLYQDLPLEYISDKKTDHHMTPPYDRAVHQVTLQKGSPLQDLLQKTELPVNSYHHQAIRSLGKDLNVMAVSEDGLIEAVCHSKKRFVWGVQWHPEFSFHKDAASRAILRAFVAACELRL